MTTAAIPDYMAQIRDVVTTRMAEISMTAETLASELGVVPREVVALLDGAVEDLGLGTFSNILYALDLRPEIVMDEKTMKMTVLIHRGR